MRSSNEKQVLQQIINEGPISRSQISRNLSLNKVTVSDIYNQLLRQEVIREIGRGNSTKSGGRRPLMGILNTDRDFVVVISLQSNQLELLVGRLDASEISRQQIPVAGINLTAVMDLLTEKLNALVAASSAILAGVLFAVDGTVANNRIITTELSGLEHFDLAKYFRDQFQVPVMIENKANLAALFERDFDSRPDAANLLTLWLDHQVQVGVVTDGRLYQGHDGRAGQIGGARFNETIAASIDERVSQQALELQLQSVLAGEFNQTSLHQAIEAHDAVVMNQLTTWGHDVAVVIQRLIINFAPDVLVLNAEVLDWEPSLLTMIQHELGQLTPRITIPVILTQEHVKTMLLGGLAAIIHHALGLDELPLLFKQTRTDPEA